MAEIVLFAGTTEGRKIAEALKGTGVTLHVCVATQYGASLISEEKNIKVYTERMDEGEMKRFLEHIRPDYCVDATHPYAILATENIQKACREKKISYLRVVREEMITGEMTEPEGTRENIIYKNSIEDAVSFLETTQGNIFITTGSKDLEKYKLLTDYKNRVTVRVLSTEEVVHKCRELGFEGKNLICMQGPFGVELNEWMMRSIDAAWLVTKSSGAAGGFCEKCEAAKRVGAGIVVIGRPSEDTYGIRLGCKEAIIYLKNRFQIAQTTVKRQIFLIGMGPGAPELLTEEAKRFLREADIYIGAKRMIETAKNIWNFPKKKYLESYKKEEIKTYLERHGEYEKAALLYSGDIGFHSGAKGAEEYFSEFEIVRAAGISSPIYLLDKIGAGWENVHFLSCHGKWENVISAICREERVCVILGERGSVSHICRELVEMGFDKVKVTVGERLSYQEERIIAGFPDKFLDQEFDTLSVAFFENFQPEKRSFFIGQKDSAFVRGSVPMTKEEVRAISLIKLGITRDGVCYDVGAGTGSVSIEMALSVTQGKVFAFEKNPQGVELLEKNKEKFHISNLEIIQGTAPEILEEREAELPMPTHVFIGGSGGKLLDIIRTIKKRNRSVRFVINAVTLDTLAKLEEIKREYPEYENMEVLCLNVAKNKRAGTYQLMSGENPVYIISFGGESGENKGNNQQSI